MENGGGMASAKGSDSAEVLLLLFDFFFSISLLLEWMVSIIGDLGYVGGQWRLYFSARNSEVRSFELNKPMKFDPFKSEFYRICSMFSSNIFRFYRTNQFAIVNDVLNWSKIYNNWWIDVYWNPDKAIIQWPEFRRLNRNCEKILGFFFGLALCEFVGCCRKYSLCCFLRQLQPSEIKNILAIFFCFDPLGGGEMIFLFISVRKRKIQFFKLNRGGISALVTTLPARWRCRAPSWIELDRPCCRLIAMMMKWSYYSSLFESWQFNFKLNSEEFPP